MKLFLASEAKHPGEALIVEDKKVTVFGEERVIINKHKR
jgi:hypothetical protein